MTCECPMAKPVPCVVCDPFSGFGTTVMVSDRLGRDAIGIDLNPAYTTMAHVRIFKDAPLGPAPKTDAQTSLWDIL